MLASSLPSPSLSLSLSFAPRHHPTRRQVDENGVITESKFKTFGCGSAIASSSVRWLHRAAASLDTTCTPCFRVPRPLSAPFAERPGTSDATRLPPLPSHALLLLLLLFQVATEWIEGKSIDEVLTIKNKDIAGFLKLPPVKLHCSMLAEDAIKVRWC